MTATAAADEMLDRWNGRVGELPIDGGLSVSDVDNHCRTLLVSAVSEARDAARYVNLLPHEHRIRAERLAHAAMLVEAAQIAQRDNDIPRSVRIPLPDPAHLLAAAQVHATIAATAPLDHGTHR